MDILQLYVSVPIAGFRVAQAREYWETYPCPPPSTVYGMLLSLVGEPNRLLHQVAELAIALVSEPQHSVVLRTLWRLKEKNLWRDPTGRAHVVGASKKDRDEFHKWVKDQGWPKPEFKLGMGLGANARPDFQELLSDVQLSIWVRRGAESNRDRALLDRLKEALVHPKGLARYGGLSLGESTHLVDEVRRWQEKDPKLCRVLLHDEQGDLSLPVWPDHIGSAGTRWAQFRLQDATVTAQPPEDAWITICAPV